MRGSRENLQERLQRLEQTGDEIPILRKLESVISEHGLVEFRSTLSMILDRLEDNSFEIAIFGRVSSGKSSLLNAMLGIDVLPVGVTPITAVPTRLLYGETPVVHVWFANRTPEEFDIAHLPEFGWPRCLPARIPTPPLRRAAISPDMRPRRPQSVCSAMASWSSCWNGRKLKGEIHTPSPKT